jgi:muramoyltetrapeptide carboxypeptidase
MSDAGRGLLLFSPAGVLRSVVPLRRAAARLGKLGFSVSIDADATARMQRFAGDDETRLAALHRIAGLRPSVALATRGGYGLTRLLDRIDWKRIARSVDAGTRWVGMSDMTSLQLGLLAHGGGVTWAGPLACDDFGRSSAEGGVDDVTEGCFVEAMSVRSRRSAFAPTSDSTASTFAARSGAATWRSSTRCSRRRTGRASRAASSSSRTSTSIPIASSGTCCNFIRPVFLDAQKAVVLGAVSGWRKSPNDRGYSLAAMLARVRAATRTPILTGLPFGHVATKVTLPVGAKVRLLVDRRQAFIAWD